VPIPGARKIKHLEDNSAAANIQLSVADLAEIEAASPSSAVAGARYTQAALQLVDR
jgi:aryl-alcohol dehydrogenase-like predicted oxidoreductase